MSYDNSFDQDDIRRDFRDDLPRHYDRSLQHSMIEEYGEYAEYSRPRTNQYGGQKSYGYVEFIRSQRAKQLLDAKKARTVPQMYSLEWYFN